MWYLLVLDFGCLVLSTHAQTPGGFCRTPVNEPGECIRLPCNTKTYCGYDSQDIPYVCCGTSKITNGTSKITTRAPFEPNPLIPDRNNCGLQYNNRIFHGEATAFDEFPWMAVIQYLKPSGERTIACAGSLISPRYILSAAHCVKEEDLVDVGQPINIRLGEYNTSSPGRDCLTMNNKLSCNQEEVNVGIEEVTLHPNYSLHARHDGIRLNDIALIRLASEVRYTEYIKPICLPLPDEASAPGDKVVVAGWGITEKGRLSDVKLKIQIPIVSRSQCSNAYSITGFRIADTQVCAGDENGFCSCKGDSGGPLMGTLPTDTSRLMIEGIVSFGHAKCGTAGFPVVHTKVAKYVSWIHSNIRA